MKPNKKKINYTEKGYKPELDPRILRAALKQRRAYYGGGKLNMKEVQGSKKQEEKLIEEMVKQDKELTEKELEEFREELYKNMCNPD